MERNRSQRRTAWLVAAIAVLAVLFVGLIIKKYIAKEAPPHVTPPPVHQEGVRTVILFFAAPDGSGLVREARDIDSCSSLVECAEEVVGELINGPLGDLTPTLPETATFRGVSQDGDTLTVDFGSELPAGLPAGSNAEMAAVYSVVDSLAVNFPQIRQVRILVEGKPVDTLKGHLDLREPLEPDFSLEKKVEAEKEPLPQAPQRRQQ